MRLHIFELEYIIDHINSVKRTYSEWFWLWFLSMVSIHISQLFWQIEIYNFPPYFPSDSLFHGCQNKYCFPMFDGIESFETISRDYLMVLTGWYGNAIEYCQRNRKSQSESVAVHQRQHSQSKCIFATWWNVQNERILVMLAAWSILMSQNVQVDTLHEFGSW